MTPPARWQRVRAVVTPGLELARTYGAKGLARRVVHESLLRSHAYAWLERAPAGEAPPLILPSVDRAAAQQVLARHPEAAQLVVDRARRLLAGNYPYFGDLTVAAGWPPQWHRHATTHADWPADRHWSTYAHLAPSAGDIKWIWEPSRFQFAWLFPRAWAVTGDRRFAAETWRGLRDWLEHNPPGRGANWFCAQELSLRCFAVLFAASTFTAEGLAPAEDLRRVGQLLFAAAHRIDRTLEHSLSQRNNHALSEAVALWTLAQVFPGAGRASQWRARAQAALRECLADQFADDGAYIQESLNYHRLAVHVLLWARFVARALAVALPAEVEPALRRSYQLLRGLLPRAGGELPNYGHNDGALLLTLSSSSHRDVRPTLQHLARELGEPLPFAPGPWDETAAWLGPPTGATSQAPAAPDGLRITSSGYLTSRRGRWMVFSRIPSHRHHRPGQADALHVDVWRDDRNLALDPGSFAYSEPAPWGNALVETRVHNTCSVGARSQMRQRGRFLWTHWSRAHRLADVDEAGVSMWAARVRCAWGQDFVHTRFVRHDGDQVDVLDAVAGGQPEVLRLHWNLDGASWHRDDRHWRDGDVMVTLDAPATATVRDVRGDPTSTLGWTSSTYGHKVACTAIEAEITAPRAWFHTVFTHVSRPVTPLPAEGLAAWRLGDLSTAVRLLVERR